jgi:hypothetical protein
MEKREKLAEIRNGKVPEEFIKKYQSLSSLILATTNSNIKERPDAGVLLECIDEEIQCLQQDFVIITNNTRGRTRSYSDDMTEISYLFIEFSDYSGRYDSTMMDSDFTRSISVEEPDMSYDSEYECLSSSYVLDYSWHYILNGKNS